MFNPKSNPLRTATVANGGKCAFWLERRQNTQETTMEGGSYPRKQHRIKLVAVSRMRSLKNPRTAKSERDVEILMARENPG